MKRLLPYLIAYSAKFLIKMITFTCRVNITGLEKFTKTASTQKCILMMWHSRLLMVAEIVTKNAPQFKYAALISKSRDAEPLAIYTNSFKVGRALRVPHNARAESLQTVIKNLKEKKEVITITPDGPRGPANKVKPGALFAAKETGAAIVPLSWTASRFWQFNTWDKMMLPKPFSTISFTIGDPITLTKENHPSKRDTSVLEDALNHLEP